MNHEIVFNQVRLCLNTSLFFILFFFGNDRIFAQTGQLTVTSRPAGALISLDDQEIGATPQHNRDVKAGFYTLRLTDPSTGLTSSRSVQIFADSLVSLHIDIGSSTGYLNVDSKPPGAEVSLGTFIGKTPVHNAPINPGAYSVRVEHPRKIYSKVIEDAVVSENGSKSINVSLPKNRRYIGKTATRIILGVASVGLYAWGVSAQAKDNSVGGTVGFTLGTVCLIGVELFSFF